MISIFGNYHYHKQIRCFFFLVLLVGSLPLQATFAQTCHCDHFITPKENYVDGKKLGAHPGDTVCIKAGKKKFLNLFNFYGTEKEPIVLINYGGLVEVGDPNWYYGCVIGKSAHFILTGTGDPAYEYGIKINQTKKGASGLALGASNFDINHIEITHTGFAGIMAKIDPNCDSASWQENFVMQHISLHHNYVHDTGGEGLYIGYTGGSKKFFCEGKEILVNPHTIENLRIYDNRVENTGWDGIQVSRAVKNCEIFNNQVLNYGMKNEKWQKAGIVIGGGTTGKLFNNYIHTGTGGGIHVFGAGENLIYNNVIINAGENGIYCKSLEPGKEMQFGYVMLNNTIIHPGKYGLFVQNLPPFTNRFDNNVIIQPEKLYVSVAAGVPLWSASHNYLNTNTHPVFDESASSTFTLKNNAPLIDKGKDVSAWGIRSDFSGHARPSGKGYDMGAYEFVDQKISTLSEGK